jgi:DNA primase large subunit
MATILDKDLIRESTVKHDGREIVVTLTEDQKISFKLKGMKSGEASISILQLYKQLNNIEDKGLAGKVRASKVIEQPKFKKSDENPVIDLYSLRASAMVTRMEYDTKVELEKVICELIKQNIKLTEI